jgi:MFS family permease
MTSSESATPAGPNPRSALFIVFLVVFIDLLGFGIVLPLLPLYAGVYLGGATETMKGLIIGGLFSSFSLMQFLFSPVWGRLSDRIGRRPILILGLLGSVLFYALFAYASTYDGTEATLAISLLFISRIGAGIAGASVSTASAVIADCTTPEKRSKGMALIGAAFGIGFTFGPLIGYLGLSYFQEQLWAPGALASGLSFLAMILAIVRLPETLKTQPGPPPAHPTRGAFSISRSIDVLKLPSVGPLILMYFLAIFAFANFEATLALYTKEVFHFGTQQSLLVFAGVGLVLMVAQGGFYRRFAGKVSEQSLMKVGLGMMFLGLGGLGAVAYASFLMQGSPDTTSGFQSLFYLATGVAVFGFAFVNPSVAALVSRRSDPARQGEILGVNQSFAAIGRILGPFIGSLVFWQHPSRTLPFVVAGGGLVLVVLMLASLGSRELQASSASPTTPASEPGS